MSESIWVINYVSRYFDDHGRTSDTSLEEDEGFFTSEAAAQQRCDELNEWTMNRWKQECEQIAEAYKVQLAAWEEHERQIEFLTANGFAPGRGNPKPREPKPLTYEDWLWSNGGKATHEIQEIEAAKPQRAA